MSSSLKKMLIVDDEENVCNALRRALSREGYELHFAREPREGLEILAKVPVDLTISDHLMPNMTGLEFLKLVRDRYPNCMRMMLTGHADMETAIRAINHGEIYRILTKPWDDTELKVTICLAFEQLEMERENRRLLAMVRSQQKFIKQVQREHPTLQVPRDASGAILIDAEETGSLDIQ